MNQGMFTFSGYLEPEEVRSIIGALYVVSRHVERDQLLFEVLWQSGARVTEALELVPEWVGLTSIHLRNLKQTTLERDEEGNPIRVLDHTAAKEVEVSAGLCKWLKDFCKRNRISQGEFIFKPNRLQKGHLSAWYVWWITGKASEKAGVFKFGKRHPRTGGKFKGAYPHLFRHSNAMKLLEETGDITIAQQQLGHKSIRTTQGYAYTKRPKIRREIAKIEW